MYKTILTIALLALAAYAHSNNYQLLIDPLDPSVLHVVAELQLTDRVLYSSHEGDDPGLWIGRISNLRAIDVKHQTSVEIRQCGLMGLLLCRPKYAGCNLFAPITCPGFRPSGGKWIINAKKGSTIRLSYDVNLDFTGVTVPGGIDSAPYRTTSGQYLVGRAIFLANGTYDEPRAITIFFGGDELSTIVTPWTERSGQRFQAQSNADLLDSISFWGNPHKFLIHEQGLTLRLATSGVGSNLVAKKLTTTLKSVVAEYFNIAQHSPNGATKPIALIATVSEHWPSDGEVIGRNISLILNSNSGEVDWTRASFEFAHEIFHLWNSQTIAPASNDMEWFREGMTDFFTLQALVRNKATPRDELIAMYQREFYSRYESDPGRGRISILDAGKSKEENGGIVYIGGCYIGMLIEQELQKTGHSAQDVFQALIASDSTYTLRSVLNTIEMFSPGSSAVVESRLRNPKLQIQWSEFQKNIELM